VALGLNVRRDWEVKWEMEEEVKAGKMEKR